MKQRAAHDSAVQLGNDQEIARRRGLEIPSVGVADDDGSDIVDVGEVVEPGELAKYPSPEVLLEADPQTCDCP